jgi:multidrug resistance efflux pump
MVLKLVLRKVSRSRDHVETAQEDPALLLGLLVVGVCGGILWRYFSKYESADDAQVDAHLYPVSARVRGYVIRVNAGDNEYVQKQAGRFSLATRI